MFLRWVATHTLSSHAIFYVGHVTYDVYTGMLVFQGLVSNPEPRDYSANAEDSLVEI